MPGPLPAALVRRTNPELLVERRNLSAGRVLCAVRATCANPLSLADRSAAQSFQSEHVPLEAWPQGGARSRPRRQCSRDPQSFSGAPRSFRAWSCAEFRWAPGPFNSVERLSLVREQMRNCFRFYIKSEVLDGDSTPLFAASRRLGRSRNNPLDRSNEHRCNGQKNGPDKVVEAK